MLVCCCRLFLGVFECVVRELCYCYFVLLLCLCVFSLNVLMRFVCDLLCDVVCVVCVVCGAFAVYVVCVFCFVCG